MCRGTQVAADDIEQRVLTWLRKPTGDVSPEGRFVLARYAPIWKVLFPQVVRGLVAQLVWEVRWDGRKDEFTVMLDEIAIAEECAKLKRRDEEAASSTRPKRERGTSRTPHATAFEVVTRSAWASAAGRRRRVVETRR